MFVFFRCVVILLYSNLYKIFLIEFIKILKLILSFHLNFNKFNIFESRNLFNRNRFFQYIKNKTHVCMHVNMI